jgi:hypothetical protein
MTTDHRLSTAVAALRSEEVTAATVRTAADEASELVRYRCHATQAWSAPAALPSSADTARLVGALHEITHHLPQTLTQAAERVTAARHDSQEAGAAVRHLAAACESLREVTRHLAQAHAAVAQLPD